eukprot:1156199-Pelagomonas_calceolata.AAC.3
MNKHTVVQAKCRRSARDVDLLLQTLCQLSKHNVLWMCWATGTGCKPAVNTEPLRVPHRSSIQQVPLVNYAKHASQSGGGTGEGCGAHDISVMCRDRRWPIALAYRAI